MALAHCCLFADASTKGPGTWGPADEVRILSQVQAQIQESAAEIISLTAELNKLRERNVIFFQDIPETGNP